MTQEDLADKVGTSQVMISKIESGTAGSSKLVLPICRELGIPEPTHFANEEQREWSQLGHLLRHSSQEQYQAALRLLRSMVKAAEDGVVTDPVEPTNGETPTPDRRRR